MGQIFTLAQYAQSTKQIVQIAKTLTSGTNIILTGWNTAGIPAAGNLSIGNTINGVVPNNTTTGAALILNGYPTTVGYPAYLTWVEASIQGAAAAGGYGMLYHRAYHAGSYAYNANVTLSTQPPFINYLPNGDYTNCQLWVECNSGFTGTETVTVGYNNQSGNASSTALTTAALTANGQMAQVPLASGDSGVSQINSVVGTGGSAGSFNIIIVRPLLYMRFTQAQGVNMYPLETLGMPQLTLESCLTYFWFSIGAGGPSPFIISMEIASN